MVSNSSFSLRLSLVRHLVKNSNIKIGLLGFFLFSWLCNMQMALMSVQSPHGVCRVMLEGAANTAIGQDSGKGSRGSNSNF